MTKKQEDNNELREILAAHIHNEWSNWMKHVASKVTPELGRYCRDGTSWISGWLPTALSERWKRQMTTPYSDLSESEKEPSRQEADMLISIFKEFKKCL